MKSSLAKAPILNLNKISKADRDEVASILTDISGAYERILRAGRKWANLSEKTKDQVLEATPPALQSVWHNLERVGIGDLHPQLVTARGIAARYLSRMPVDAQTKYLTERFKCLLPDGDHRPALRNLRPL